MRDGDLVVVLADAANRDPAVLRSGPLRLCRRSSHTLSFGADMRHCLGSYLVWVQLRAALAALSRLPECGKRTTLDRTSQARCSLGW